MTKTATVRTRIEPELKDQAEGVLKKIGLSPTEFLRMAYRQVVMRQGLPFDALIPNATTVRAIKETVADRKVGRLPKYKGKTAVGDMLKDLEADSDK
ncbi:MAG: type II toxin-antitoxin system RelB/DinJ family antitoxin [Hyphomicrobiales bacterium]|nr:type II toxin-antitoxin system RelB/DinJ family antitoxin [Hyphomicrobiales bacterium]